MRWLVAMALFPGCVLSSSQPGDPEVLLSSSWIQGEPTEARVYWAYACDGGDDWTCPSTTIAVQRVACQGCTVIDDLAGQSFRSIAPIVAVATTDGPITITAIMRFDATGQLATVLGTTTGDHEVALEATCWLIDSATLAKHDLGITVPSALFRPCGATRLATDTVVVSPSIRTAGGVTRFPFCHYGTGPCTNGDGARFRPLSALAITPAPTGWGQTDDRDLANFAVLPPLGDTSTVSLTTSLAGGATSTTSVAIPPVQ